MTPSSPDQLAGSFKTGLSSPREAGFLVFNAPPVAKKATALFSLTGDGSEAAALRGAALGADGHSAYVFCSQQVVSFST